MKNIRKYLHIILIVLGAILAIGGIFGSTSVGNMIVGIALIVIGVIYYRNYIERYNPNSKDPIVYHYGNSEVYHRDAGCQALDSYGHAYSDELEEMHESKAVKMGLRPCKTCDYLKNK